MAKGQRVLANGDVFVHMPATDEHRDVALLTGLLGEPPLPVPTVHTPAIFVDGRVHTAATAFLATRAAKARATQQTTAESLAYWIHWLRTERGHISSDEANSDVFVATEEDLHDYHADRQFRPGPWRVEATTWRRHLSAIKQFHEYARQRYGLPLPLTLHDAYTASGHVVKTTGLSPRVRRTSAGTAIEPAWAQALIQGAWRMTANGDDLATDIAERDVAMLSLCLGTGVRRRTAHVTTIHELPPARPHAALNKFLVADAITKNDAGGMALAFERRLQAVRDYIDGARRDHAALTARHHRPPDPLLLTRANQTDWEAVDDNGVIVHGRWAQADEHTRRRMIHEDGTSPVIFLSNDRGLPISYSNAGAILRAARQFTIEHIQPAFPAHFRLHDCRHTFAVHLVCAIVLGRLRHEFDNPSITSPFTTPLIRDAVHIAAASLGHADPATTKLYLTSATHQLMAGIPADHFVAEL